jgi:hypothetical protein
VSNTVCGFNALDHTNALCPNCNTPGKKIRPETLKSLLKNDRLPANPNGYSLCLSPECNVIYFGEQTFLKDDIKVKVWFKESDSDTPVCYCRNVTAKDIFEHIAVRGCCNNIEDIQSHTGANTGKDCLTQNPAGS